MRGIFFFPTAPIEIGFRRHFRSGGHAPRYSARTLRRVNLRLRFSLMRWLSPDDGQYKKAVECRTTREGRTGVRPS